jgi:CheY-like chemotaxis protein
MPKQVARVILASEYPSVRHLLKGLIENEPGNIVVGQAENATKALSLARNLRPDFAIIDSYLPHVIGLDMLPLSRAGGLDTAQAISEEIPNIRVILLTNTETEIPMGTGFGQDIALSFAQKELEATVPLKLRELYCDTSKPCPLVFANVDTRSKADTEQKKTDIVNAVIFIGGLGILVGLGLTATMFLATLGGFIALAGGAAMFLGAAAKLVSSLRFNKRRRK